MGVAAALVISGWRPGQIEGFRWSPKGLQGPNVKDLQKKVIEFGDDLQDLRGIRRAWRDEFGERNPS